MQVHGLPAFDSNYIWLLQPSKQLPDVIVIDPGEALAVRSYLEAHSLRLSAIWNTHHHADHVGGNRVLQAWANCPVVGLEADRARLPGLTKGVNAGDRLRCGEEEAEVLVMAGHTRHHAAYWLPKSALLFCGDVVFSLGCGRLFEGTAADLWEGLEQLKALPDVTQLYCAHEYTLANGRFALHEDPSNLALRAYLEECQTKRDEGLPTIPTTLAREKALNPFMRASSVEALAALRQRKDVFT
jgi:hydroxyacylglutathione hydrolase